MFCMSRYLADPGHILVNSRALSANSAVKNVDQPTTGINSGHVTGLIYCFNLS